MSERHSSSRLSPAASTVVPSEDSATSVVGVGGAARARASPVWPSMVLT